MLTESPDGGAGWLLGASLSWAVLAIWAAGVLIYGLTRSRGEAPQDEIRGSGPIF